LIQNKTIFSQMIRVTRKQGQLSFLKQLLKGMVDQVDQVAQVKVVTHKDQMVKEETLKMDRCKDNNNHSKISEEAEMPSSKR